MRNLINNLGYPKFCVRYLNHKEYKELETQSTQDILNSNYL